MVGKERDLKEYIPFLLYPRCNLFDPILNQAWCNLITSTQDVQYSVPMSENLGELIKGTLMKYSKTATEIYS